MDGVIIVNKESGYSSREVVNKVSKILKTKKLGHTGTLDPLATGVLVICIGNATKLVDVITSENKTYIAEVTLGIKTDTLDLEGNILDDKDVYRTKKEIELAILGMKGKYIQEVPLYSAVRVDGKKLYEYAREGVKVDLPKREVSINEISLIDDVIYENGKTKFRFECNVSKGTYIRSLVNDIALKLNTVGVMSGLKRIKQGMFNINSSYTLQDIELGNYKIISTIDVLNDYKKINIDEKLEFKVVNGAIIDNNYGTSEVLFVKNNEAIALYKTYEKDKTKLKPWKMFRK